MRRRLAAIFAVVSLALLVGACAAWLLSTRRFSPSISCTFYDQRGVPYRWLKGMGIPAGLVLRIDRSRQRNAATAADRNPLSATSPATASANANRLLWQVSPGAGKVFDQPAEWAVPQIRRLDAPYRDLVTHRLLLPWWLLVLLLGAAPARWTFVRLRRAHRADHGRCPQCGEDLRLLDAAGQCSHCGAVAAEIAA